MITEFLRLPELFVDRYDSELQTWARKFGEWGPQCMVRLRGPIRGVAAVNEHGEAPLVFATLKAEVLGGRVVVMPADETQEDLIRRHIDALRN